MVFCRMYLYIYRGRGDPNSKFRHTIKRSCSVLSIQDIVYWINRRISRVTALESHMDGPGVARRGPELARCEKRRDA